MAIIIVFADSGQRMKADGITESFKSKIFTLILGVKFPFLNATSAGAEGRKSSKAERERISQMQKERKLGECVALCNIVVNSLNDLSEALSNELKLIFKALEIEDQDAEKIEDAKLYGIALDLDYNSSQLKNISEEVQSIIKDLEKLKL